MNHSTIRNNPVATVRNTALRCKAAGIPLGEGALRRLLRTKQLRATYIGNKALICWADVLGLFDLPGDEQGGCAGNAAWQNDYEV